MSFLASLHVGALAVGVGAGVAVCWIALPPGWALVATLLLGTVLALKAVVGDRRGSRPA